MELSPLAPVSILQVCRLSFAGRHVTSSLESLSACDMNTIHTLADPHLRYELKTQGQYCGPIHKQTDDIRDYFDDYCNCLFFPNWATCKDEAVTLLVTNDDELEMIIQV